jgi:hypothetical protein
MPATPGHLTTGLPSILPGQSREKNPVRDQQTCRCAGFPSIVCTALLDLSPSSRIGRVLSTVPRVVAVGARSNNVIVRVGSSFASGFQVLGGATILACLSHGHAVAIGESLGVTDPHGQAAIEAQARLVDVCAVAHVCDFDCHLGASVGKNPDRPTTGDIQAPSGREPTGQDTGLSEERIAESYSLCVAGCPTMRFTGLYAKAAHFAMSVVLAGSQAHAVENNNGRRRCHAHHSRYSLRWHYFRLEQESVTEGRPPLRSIRWSCTHHRGAMGF